jgi:hypothetical protein
MGKSITSSFEAFSHSFKNLIARSFISFQPKAINYSTLKIFIATIVDINRKLVFLLIETSLKAQLEEKEVLLWAECMELERLEDLILKLNEIAIQKAGLDDDYFRNLAKETWLQFDLKNNKAANY